MIQVKNFKIEAIIIIMFAILSLGSADCCGTTPCADGSKNGFCCGVGDCNIFCCNCDNGCRPMYCDTQKQYCYDKGAGCYVGCSMGPPISGCYSSCDVLEH